jgi:transcriptional regulator with XRE-family HTH domain
MKYVKFRKSIHSKEHLALRNFWIKSRKNIGLSQQQLADKLGVIYSLIGKIETGDRRLDSVETIEYCKALNVGILDFAVVVEKVIDEKLVSQKKS